MENQRKPLQIEEDDDEPIQIPTPENEDDKSESLCLIGKLWTQSTFNAFSLLDTMKKLWNPAYGMTGREIEKNLFSFPFNHKRDMDKVLKMEPWTLNKHPLVLKKAEPTIQPSAMVMDETPFWIRVYDLPLAGRNTSILQQIGKKCGRVIETDHSTIKGLNRSIRIKVMINLNKPLRRGTKIKLGVVEPIWLPLKYKRLQSFCYCCGLLGHTSTDCEDCDANCNETNGRNRLLTMVIG